MSLAAWKEAAMRLPETRNGVKIYASQVDAKTLDIVLTVPGAGVMPKVRVTHNQGGLTVQWMVWLFAALDADGMPIGLDATIDTLRVAWAEFLLRNPYLPGARGRKPSRDPAGDEEKR